MTSLFPDSLYPAGSQELFEQYLGDVAELGEIFAEQRRRILAVLQHEGTTCKLLQLKVAGTRCPYWNQESQQCPKPLTTPRCFNTGWVGGYEAPIDISIRFVAPGMTRDWYENGQRVTKEMRSWTLWRPLLKPYDVVVKARTGEKYIIQSVTASPPWRDDLILVQELDLKLCTTEPVRNFGPSDGLVLTL